MQIVRAFVAVSVLLLASISGAWAQEPTQQQYEALMRWVANHQRVINAMVSPLQQMPDPFDEMQAPASERSDWVSRARSWSGAYRAALLTARADAERLGPVPEAGYVTALYERQNRAMPEMLDGFIAFLDRYDAGVEAIARNDPDATMIADLSVIDAQLLIQTQFRNLNALQAESLSEGPQKHLLRSFASSYDAMIAVWRASRAARVGEDISASAATEVRAAAEAMRQHSRSGRLAAQAAEAALPARVPPEQSDFLRRIRTAYQSFGPTFDREDELAGLLTEIAALLASGAAFDDGQARLDQVMERIGLLDYERLGDIQRRTALVQVVTPPF